jgi:regulator of sigma E protease
MNGLYMLVGTLVALGVLITFHEFGHFWVARRCGVRVLRFSVGFGKPLLSWHDRHGTEFVIAALPLGGYVKMLDEREAPVPEALREQSFNSKTVGQRMAIVVAGPLANFLLALLFFWMLAMLGTQQVRPLVGSVEPESPAALAGVQSGEEILAIDGKATGGWSEVNLQLVRRLGETGVIELLLKPAQGEGEVLRQIEVHNWLATIESPDPIIALGLQPWRPLVQPLLAVVEADGPARRAGLLPGDRLLLLDGTPLADWSELVTQVRQKPGQMVRLTYMREGQERQADVLLGTRTEGEALSGYLGAGVASPQWPPEALRQVDHGPFGAVLVAAQRTWSMSLLTLDSLRKMLLGELSVKNLSGPITIAKVAGATAQSGLGDFLNFLAYLSISLGVLNLLPVPVLDGGHLLFYLVEWVRGRPLSERIQGAAMQIGIFLIIALMLLALFNDLGRL